MVMTPLEAANDRLRQRYSALIRQGHSPARAAEIANAEARGDTPPPMTLAEDNAQKRKPGRPTNAERAARESP